MPEANPEFVLEVYQDFLSAWRGKIKTRDEKRREKAAQNTLTKPFGAGREPQQLHAVLQQLAQQRGWDREIAQSEVCHNWAQVVGAHTAARSKVLHLDSGVLTVQAQTQPWVVELRRLKNHILEKIREQYPAAQIVELRVLPPHTVSWNHGYYTVRGRGPRDTYDWAELQ